MNVAPGVETDRVTFQGLAVAFILSTDGPLRLAQRPRIQEAETSRVIIDGIRHVSTYQQLKR